MQKVMKHALDVSQMTCKTLSHMYIIVPKYLYLDDSQSVLSNFVGQLRAHILLMDLLEHL